MTIPRSQVSTGLALCAQTIGLCRWIDQRPILQDINISVESGQFLAVLGANGAGKSTLLKILATLMPCSDGQVRLFGQPLDRTATSLRRRIGLVGHQSMLYRDLTAQENLVFFAKLYGVENPRVRAQQLLESVGLADRAADPVKSLSRGMTQRLSVARALVHEPELLLADEPFAGLDAPSAVSLETMLQNLHRSGKTIILVNHDIPQSLRLAQHTVVLRRGCVVMDLASSQTTATQVLEEVIRP